MSPAKRTPEDERHPIFRVDTHIFRELGELLVGRDSTALLELIKNSYDADATEVIVTATDLDYPDRGQIVVQDNGSGMDGDQFVNGFLRIASRFKEEGARRSAHFRRRYTGSKGIGRLAAHKLASLLDVTSVHGRPGRKSAELVVARIDWGRIEEQRTLSDLSDEISMEQIRLARPRPPGTVISLSRLRRAWSERDRVRFIHECRAFQIPDALKDGIPVRLLAQPLLFHEPHIRDAKSEDPGCEVSLEGDFREGDAYWDLLVDRTNWVLEIDSLTDRNVVRYAIAPTESTALAIQAKRRIFRHPHPTPDEGPFFQARVLVRDEQIRDKSLLGWSRQMSGIRVYMEGFRVLPYGDVGDDWLSLDRDYARRSWPTDPLFKSMSEADTAGDWQLLVQPSGSYTGAVFLTQENAPSLRMLVNREGFVVDRAFEAVVTTVRRGIDLLTRARAAAKSPMLQRRREDRAALRSDKSLKTSAPPPFSEITTNVVETLKEARRTLSAGGDSETVSRQLAEVQTAIGQIGTRAEHLREAAAMTRVLASLGTQMAGFVHEIRNLLGTAIAVHDAVGRLRSLKEFSPAAKRRLNEVYQTLGDMRRQVERQATYLIDVTSQDARRRRSRQKLKDRFESALRLVATSLDRLNISVQLMIRDELVSPPMFPAELTTVFSNLLTNAVKAAGKGGKIRAGGSLRPDGRVSVVIENTGAAVDPRDGERWFDPFESTTAEVDSILGQGMGLGLTITRDVLDQYGATIHFIKPTRGFATAVEIQFPV